MEEIKYIEQCLDVYSVLIPDEVWSLIGRLKIWPKTVCR